ncbi:hypothetical protein BSL78_24347 [Apostichopus japonicus]|uniref:Uncharacterized protein n=1 Tax=Stichopus japonicus TaxID=307972 RepID=A0A2G8JSS9_STIJA|nr:hypothetical protein BSL78_24347 [Apostichopus japonicus]
MASNTIKTSGCLHFSLMRWLRIMFLDCHVALQNLCNCISWLSPPLLQSKVKNIYKLLAEDSFTEFRYFCEQIEAMHLVPPGSPPVCPACPKFCSNFQASDHLRTKNRSKKVDETGVFGAVCRHEMPIKFFSLKQGERLGNAVFLIKHLLEGKPEERKLYILYDIACKLQAHLKGNESAPPEQRAEELSEAEAGDGFPPDPFLGSQRRQRYGIYQTGQRPLLHSTVVRPPALGVPTSPRPFLRWGETCKLYPAMEFIRRGQWVLDTVNTDRIEFSSSPPFGAEEGRHPHPRTPSNAYL